MQARWTTPTLPPPPLGKVLNPGTPFGYAQGRQYQFISILSPFGRPGKLPPVTHLTRQPFVYKDSSRQFLYYVPGALYPFRSVGIRCWLALPPHMNGIMPISARLSQEIIARSAVRGSGYFCLLNFSWDRPHILHPFIYTPLPRNNRDFASA